MKVAKSQISIAIVCALLGFLLSYQFKVLSKADSNGASASNQNDILAEIENLKKEKEELTKTNEKVTEELKQMEENATKNGDLDKEIKNQLDTARMYLGAVDVTGPGIVLTISPKSSIFNANSKDNIVNLGEEEIVHIINLLWYSGAEAISINDIRITPQTGIKTAGTGISIGGAGRIYPKEKIIIKVIGDKSKLNVAVSFPGAFDYSALRNYNNDIKTEDEIVITKSTQSLKNDYIKNVKE